MRIWRGVSDSHWLQWEDSVRNLHQKVMSLFFFFFPGCELQAYFNAELDADSTLNLPPIPLLEQSCEHTLKLLKRSLLLLQLCSLKVIWSSFWYTLSSRLYSWFLALCEKRPSDGQTHWVRDHLANMRAVEGWCQFFKNQCLCLGKVLKSKNVSVVVNIEYAWT